MKSVTVVVKRFASALLATSINRGRLRANAMRIWSFQPGYGLLILGLAPLIAGCTPGIALPNDFWQMLAIADRDGQKAQREALALVLMHDQAVSQRKDVNLQSLLERVEDPTKSLDKGDLYILDRLSLSAFLTEEDFQAAATAYDEAREYWNSLYDTLIAIVSMNRSIPDWPNFPKEVERAHKLAQEFSAKYQWATGRASDAKNRIVTLAKQRPASNVAQASSRPDPAQVAQFAVTDLLPTTLFKNGVDLIDLFKQVGQMHERERAYLVTELKARKWATPTCLKNPKDESCKQPQTAPGSEPKQGGSRVDTRGVVVQ